MERNKKPGYGTAAQAKELRSWLAENSDMPGVALPALQKAQEIYGFVPREVQEMIADADNKRLDKTDILIACIDGDVLPSGTCAEIGKFHEKIARGDKKLIVGICTDNRQCALTHSEAKDAGGASALGEQQYSYQNLYVTGLIKEYGVLVSNIEDVIAEINRYFDVQELMVQ